MSVSGGSVSSEAQLANTKHVADMETDERQSADEMDERRREQIAYEYLCHLEEARLVTSFYRLVTAWPTIYTAVYVTDSWVESCIHEELPATTELEENLTNGVILAKLANFFAPSVAPIRKIFDKDLTRFKERGLHFRHTDNIMHLIRAMEHIGLPQVFYPETTDIYDMKNMPRAIYCIHALSLYLYKLGIAPLIQDLYGTATFTEEEISAMKQALDKYGIQMPSFGKIGGILANELCDNDAALHAAIVAINDTIDKGVAADTVSVMQNPDSRLIDISADLADNYQQILSESKTKKCEQCDLKGKNEADLDLYDRMLTQAEIQGHINKVNLIKAVADINMAVDERNESSLMNIMSSREAALSAVRPDNSGWYLQTLTDAKKSKEGSEDGRLDHSTIQSSVNTANDLADRVRNNLPGRITQSLMAAGILHTHWFKVEGALQKINALLDGGDPHELITLLQKPDALLPTVDAARPNLYMDNLCREKMEKEGDLTHDELTELLKVLLAIASINKCIDNKDEDRLLEALVDPEAKLEEVDEGLGTRYLSHFIAVKNEKCEEVGVEHDDLNHMEIQALIEYVNTEVQEENDSKSEDQKSEKMLSALSKINEIIPEGDDEAILASLHQASAKLTGVKPKNAEIYAILLRELRVEKSKNDDGNAELWHEDIQACVDRGNIIADDGEKLSVALATINESIEKADSADLFLALKSKSVGLLSITPECADAYHIELKAAKAKKETNGWNGWTDHTVQGYSYYDNVLTQESRWSLPPGYQPDYGHLSRDEIQAVISQVTAGHDHELFLRANEPSVVKIQSQWRRHKAEKEFQVKKDLVLNQIPAAVKIQSSWKGYSTKKKYDERKAYLKANEDSVIKIQSTVRMHQAQKKYLDRKKYFNDNIKRIIKIQAFLRANMAHNDYKKLGQPDPPAKNVRKFLHLLENDHIDFQEELDLQKLKAQVVTDIRSLSQLEKDLNTMDIKIGLLVRNRITLQDVVMHNTKLKREKAESLTAANTTSGLKGLSRDKRKQLEGYQHLFYLLQTNPNYLARLIFKMPQTKTNKFLESVILTLYNYASNNREEYLLLKLFETALKEEIADKIDQIVEIITGNPTVIKMVVHFNRGAKGQTSLRDILAPLVKEVLTDKTLVINTSPTETYKQWINQMETETGKASELPYDVDNDFAMQQPEVAKRVEASIKSLTVASDKFLNSFIKSKDKIPYGMRHIAKTLKESLELKFPEATEDEVLKVVGNLIYYRYMNPAIVAPDAFDIVDVSLDKALTQDQRRNLGSIAKVLQYAASNKMFDRENAHLSSLNPYISESFKKFKQFLIDASTIEEPEVYFNIDQYSDVTMVTKPVVYMTVQEIIDTHQLLSEHVNEISDTDDDPLRELLDDLGTIPLVEDVVGLQKNVDNNTNEDNEQMMAKMGRTEISLTLTNKFEIPDDDDSDMKALFVRTKKLIVEVMRVQPAENLTQMLETPATKQQELEHAKIMKSRQDEEKKQKKSAQVERSNSMHGESRLPLKEVKQKILRNLKMLEKQGLVQSGNHFQEIINAIAKDIRNQRKYRQSRKQELTKLKLTLENLNRKSSFYEEQVDYYNQYIKVCLDNLNKKKRTGSKKSKKQQPNVVTKGTIKYSAQKLYEKGVILEIQGLPEAQVFHEVESSRESMGIKVCSDRAVRFKNVQFEISTAEDVGVFEVFSKFMGVSMEKVELVFQDLLQLQYNGVAVMQMFGRAKINVNLLIFLLNKKFYGK